MGLHFHHVFLTSFSNVFFFFFFKTKAFEVSKIQELLMFYGFLFFDEACHVKSDTL